LPRPFPGSPRLASMRDFIAWKFDATKRTDDRRVCPSESDIVSRGRCERTVSRKVSGEIPGFTERLRRIFDDFYLEKETFLVKITPCSFLRLGGGRRSVGARVRSF